MDERRECEVILVHFLVLERRIVQRPIDQEAVSRLGGSYRAGGASLNQLELETNNQKGKGQ